MSPDEMALLLTAIEKLSIVAVLLSLIYLIMRGVVVPKPFVDQRIAEWEKRLADRDTRMEIVLRLHEEHLSQMVCSHAREIEVYKDHLLACQVEKAEQLRRFSDGLDALESEVDQQDQIAALLRTFVKVDEGNV
jgi:hypothetical protein